MKTPPGFKRWLQLGACTPRNRSMKTPVSSAGFNYWELAPPLHLGTDLRDSRLLPTVRQMPFSVVFDCMVRAEEVQQVEHTNQL